MYYFLDYGCIGELSTVHRYYPGSIGYFLFNGILIKDIAAGARHVAALDCKIIYFINFYFFKIR